MELKHYGIKGQEWGVKNGPPYPLTRVSKGNEKTTNKIYKSLSKTEKHGFKLVEQHNEGKEKRLTYQRSKI